MARGQLISAEISPDLDIGRSGDRAALLVAKQPRKQRVPPPLAEGARETPPAPGPRLRYQIESGTRGVYVGSTYAERGRDWQTFAWSPDEARIIRFDDRHAAEEELARVQSYAANARSREVE